MEASAPRQCVKCKKAEEEVKLSKCSICFKYYCDECAYQLGGRQFCGQFCAEFFFFSEPDD